MGSSPTIEDHSMPDVRGTFGTGTPVSLWERHTWHCYLVNRVLSRLIANYFAKVSVIRWGILLCIHLLEHVGCKATLFNAECLAHPVLGCITEFLLCHCTGTDYCQYRQDKELSHVYECLKGDE